MLKMYGYDLAIQQKQHQEGQENIQCSEQIK